jgi:hypothetical protein
VSRPPLWRADHAADVVSRERRPRVGRRGGDLASTRAALDEERRAGAEDLATPKLSELARDSTAVSRGRYDDPA